MKINIKNKKAFTIVELVIVIAVIAILAGVLIPTFSGIVDKANQSSAYQTARSTLSNSLSMSSTASLPGKDDDGNYKTVIIVDEYAFGYDGNQLESIDYPGVDNSSIDELVYDTNYNSIIVSYSNLNNSNNLNNVADIIIGASDLNVKLAVAEIDSNYYVTDGTLACKLYLNSDISNKAVVFTTFDGSISEELKAKIIKKSGINGYDIKDSGNGSSINFGDLD